ncbi:YbjN domain-containing protein [Oxynema sp. CENA135]|uniref:YbjN domain-containing protein n=1 Tax=Oxynema sp. CENA135 TaxID=984206 RepID=UPI00190BC9BF|nr:YbjN domain-containing protein [Oxynema sp. CENA135]MBK4728358.1 YbjN domain-containing protein [Oxynema sp. CENA135]
MTPEVETQSSESQSTQELLDTSTPIDLVEEIETVIASMAQDQKVMFAHSEAGYFWKFQYGSVQVFVQLTGTGDEDTLSVWSFVLDLPAKNEPQLMRKLLEMNWLSTYEARFAIVDDRVVVLSNRTVADINPSEISQAITIVATLADDNDELLQAEYK